MVKGLINAIQSGVRTTTENGMPSYVSTGDACLNLFAKIGTMKNASEEDILTLYQAAEAENKRLARAILLWSRDILEGAGLRHPFQTVLKHWTKVKKLKSSQIQKLIQHNTSNGIGYWKEYMNIITGSFYEPELLASICGSLIQEEPDSLCAKWMPRKGLLFNQVMKHLEMKPKELRKLLVNHSHTVEQQMCAQEWKEIDYAKVPSIASSRYAKAFRKHNQAGYDRYIDLVKNGKAKMNAKAIWPHEIVAACASQPDQAEAQWMNLPNWMVTNKERLLPVCDSSSSMSDFEISKGVTPLTVAMALSIYISERNEGVFKDAFINFDNDPTINTLSGSLSHKIDQLKHTEWGSSTNLEETFQVILDAAVNHKLSQEDMPTAIIILSDMQFNKACNRRATAIEMIKRKYESYGLKMPKIIFWNVADKAVSNGVPATADEADVALIGGFSPSLLKTVLSGQSTTPSEKMMETVWKERYLLL